MVLFSDRQQQKPPRLGFPQYNKPFELHTDAYMLGLEAVLHQEQDNQKQVMVYANRGLSKSEKELPNAQTRIPCFQMGCH
jgi:hypothetical protein